MSSHLAEHFKVIIFMKLEENSKQIKQIYASITLWGTPPNSAFLF